MKHIIRYISITITVILFSFNVNAQINADFTANADSGCGYLAVTFTDLSTGNPVQWEWNFGDGNTSTFQNPSTFYSIPGTYTVTLTVTDGNGFKSTISMPSYITIFKLPSPVFSSDVTGGCVALPVNFIDQTSAGNSGIATWQWDFGDGSFSTSQNPSHTYSSVGSYQVSLEVYDSLGCTKKKVVSNYINVQNLPTIGFSASSTIACTVPFTVDFINATDTNLTFIWDFGDSATSTLYNPSHTYVSFGTYNVYLTGTDPTGCDNAYGPVTITISPYTADFNLSATAACLNTQVTFNDLSSPSPTQWSWDFGDGGSSTQKNPAYTYTNTGSLNVTLISSTSLGCSDTIVKNITVYPLPSISFSVDDQTACNQPFSVTFTDNTPNATAWQWDIDNPEQSLGIDTFTLDYTSQSFTHVYDTSSGTFTVKLIVTDNNGCQDTLVQYDYIDNNAPSISASINKSSGCIPLDINFNGVGTSNENIISWSWDFGDPASGVNNTSSLQNPLHTYNDTGTFVVNYSFTDAGGCTRNAQITIRAGIPPVTDFYILDSLICYGGQLDIYDTSSAYSNEWTWGYSISVDSLGYVYPSPSSSPEYGGEDLSTLWLVDTGYFNVSHVAIFNGCKGDTVSRDFYFYVNLPKAIFSSTPLIFCESNTPYTVSVTDESVGADTYLWDFGDPSSGVNNNSTDSNPAPHTYTSPGLYLINLSVFNNASGCTHETSSTVFISSLTPSITIDTTPLTGCNPSSFTIQNTTTGNEGLAAWGWYFGDSGVPSDWYNFYSHITDFDLFYNVYVNQANDTLYNPDSTYAGTYIAPYHEYDTSGLFSIYLVVTGAGSGCVDTVSLVNSVRIYQNPSALYSQDVLTGCAPLVVNFEDTSAQGDAPIVSWDWNFGDGNTDTLTNPEHTFQIVGTFPVTLTVTDTNNCIGIITKDYEAIVTKPFPGISAVPFACHYNNILFSNTSSGVGLSYVWNFGDGSPLDSSTSPTHHFNITSDTSFTVSLYAVDVNGCDSSYSKNIDLYRPYAGYYLTDLNNNCPPFFATFIDTSSTISTWYYNFGDGSSTTFTSYSNADTISHVYNESGIYDVTLIVKDVANCYDTLSIPDYVKVDGPLGTFTYDPKDGCAPLDVTFMPADIYNAATYTWIFGDGSAVYTKDTVTHTYNQAGTFIPVLILEDSLNYSMGDSVTCVFTIIPDSSLFISGPLVDFDIVGEDTSCTGFSVTFVNYTNQDSVDAWLWDFGDGTTSTDMNPTHFFSNLGSYNVSLQAFVFNGIDTCIYTVTQDDLVTVFDPPQVTYAASPASGCAPLEVQFTISAVTLSFPANSFAWDFGNGQTSTDQNPTTTYTSTGSYNVNLDIVYKNGCEATYATSSAVNVYPVPVADFNIVPEVDGNNFSYMNFDNISQGASTYFWDFGDGSTSTDENPTYQYDQEGVYSIQLIAITSNGCEDTILKDQYIFLEPQLSNTFTPNGDGNNDFFVLQVGDGLLEGMWIKIYDRWGRLRYEEQNYNNDWDGKDKNGKLLPPDTYYYIVNYQNKTVWAGWLRIF